MKFTFLNIIILTFILIEGCSQNKLVLLKDNLNCKTVVEGFYSSSRIWNTLYPAFLLKNGTFKLGSEIKRDSSGIYFVEEKTRIFQSIDTLFYPYKDIQTVID